MPTTDDSMLTLADRAELGRVLDEHRPALLAMLRRRIDPALNGRLDADDIFSEAAQTACRRWAAFKEQTAVSPRVWLYGLARERYLDARRRHAGVTRDHHRDRPYPQPSSVQLNLGLVDAGTPPLAAAARAEVCERVHRAMDLLKDDDRDILWMHQAEGLTFREAGVILGLTENTATVRYVRALRRLKDLWQQLYGTEGTGSWTIR